MNILAVETALGACSVAVASSGRILAQEHRPMMRGHAEALAPMVERAMNQARMEFRALQRIAVTTGPGTFTGQRVGLAFARAMAVALKIPAVGTTTLEAMAAEALNGTRTASWALAVADARRREVYIAALTNDGELVISPQLMPVEQVGQAAAAVAERLGQAPLLAGSAVPTVQPDLRMMAIDSIDSGVRQPTAAFVALICERLQDCGPVRPLYFRPPDAKLPAVPG